MTAFEVFVTLAILFVMFGIVPALFAWGLTKVFDALFGEKRDD